MTDWTGYEINVVTRAAMRAPSVHNMRPWKLRMLDDRVELCERPEAALPQHDPYGRDRMISCGTALANVELALRTLGWATRTTTFPDERTPWVVALVDAPAHRTPTDTEARWYAAIFRRHSYRAQFAATQVPGPVRDRLVSAHGMEDDTTRSVQLRPVAGWGESAVLAELLVYAGAVLSGDRAYQRELAIWTGEGPGGLPEPRPASDTLPWAGLVRTTTHLPDVATLTDRLARERALILLTGDDAPVDHLRAGLALERTWLAATAAGLVASVQTKALHLNEVRAGLIERLDLAGYPQLIMRIGYPAVAEPALSAPVSDRRPVNSQKEN